MSFTSPTVPGPFFQLADLGLPISPQQFMNIWLSQMQLQYPGYVPSASNPEYVQAQIFASWAADIAQLCNVGANELFRNFGTKLLNVPYQAGVAATTAATVTAIDTLGHVLPAQQQVTLTLGGVSVGFQVASTLTIPAGQSSGTVTLTALQSGSVMNGATSPVAFVTTPSWVQGITCGSASGGVDQESDDAYLVRLAAMLALSAVRPITATDFANTALRGFVPQSGQQQVGRATAIDGYDTASRTFTGTTNGTTTVSAVSSFTGLTVGTALSASDITAGQTITAINTGASTLTMSLPASASTTGETITATGSYGNSREVTVCVTDASGNALTTATMNAVQTYLSGLREVNFIVNVVAPNYTSVYVTVQVKGIAGYTVAQVQQSVQTALLAYLSPAQFGLPQGQLTGWVNSQTIWRSRVEAAIQSAAGVDHIITGTLAFGTGANPTNTTGDLTFSGPFPLPQSTATTIPLSAITVT